MKLCVVGTYELFNTLFSASGPPTAAVREKHTDEQPLKGFSEEINNSDLRAMQGHINCDSPVHRTRNPTLNEHFNKFNDIPYEKINSTSEH
jgi:hypothetical protein